MELLNLIVDKGAWVFAILNVIMIPAHLFLLRRSFRIADNFKVDHSIPFGMVAHQMHVQRSGDVAAYRQIYVCATICIVLTATTSVNVAIYILPLFR